MQSLRGRYRRARGELGHALKFSYDTVDDRIRSSLGLRLQSLESIANLEMPTWNRLEHCQQAEQEFGDRVPADPLQHQILLTLGDLSNDVHPIFARANFRGINYDALLPVLRLATRFIDTDCLLPFWTTMMLGNDHKVRHGPRRKDWHWATFYLDHVPLEHTRALTRQRLQQLAEVVSFREASYHDSFKVDGQAKRRPRGAGLRGLLASRAGDRDPGYATQIEICRFLLIALEHSWGVDMETHLRLRVHLAKTLVHELGHCAANLVHKPGRKVWFEHCKVYEHGYNWEESLFGAIGSLNFSAGRDIATSWLDHTATGISHKSKRKTLTVGAHRPDYALGWYVPISYIQQFFNTQWWDCVVPSRGAAALQVPRQIGTVLKRRRDRSYAHVCNFSEEKLAAHGFALPPSVEHIGHGIVQSRRYGGATPFNGKPDQPMDFESLGADSQLSGHSRCQTPDHWSFENEPASASG